MWAISMFAKDSALAQKQQEALLLVAQALAAGLSLIEALEDAMTPSTYPPYRRAFTAAVASLQAGRNPHDTFAAPAVACLPGRVRVLLATDLPDREKGLLLTAFVYSFFGTNPSSQATLTYLAIALGFFFLVVLALFLFVIPQFQEILLGMRVPIPWSLEMLIYLTRPLISLLNGLGFLMVIGGFGVVWYRLVMLTASLPARDREWAQSLQFLSELDTERRVPVLSRLANPILFPLIAQDLSSLNRQLNTDPDQTTVWGQALPPVVAWCVLNAFVLRGSQETLRLASEFMQQRAKGRQERAQALVEIGGILGLGLAVGFVCGTCLQTMSVLLEASL